MQRLLYILSAILLNASIVSAQSTAFARLQQQQQLFPQEKTYVHTDAADYYAASRIWLKVYVVDALSNKPLRYAPHVYAELIAPDAAIIRRVKIARRDSIYAGYIDIPADAVAGRYAIRAYTRYMTNTPLYTGRQIVYIHSPHKDEYDATADYVCRLFPEGGYLVADEANTVAYEVCTLEGRMADHVTLTLSDEQGRQVLSLDSAAACGTFTIVAQENTRYRMQCSADGRSAESASLRCPKRSVALHAEHRGDTLVLSTLRHNCNEQLYLLAHSHTIPLLMQPLEKDAVFSILRDSLPDGVTAFMLVNGQLRVYSQRLIYTDNGKSRCSMLPTSTISRFADSTINQSTNYIGNKIILSIPDSLLHEGETADLSVAVTDRFAISRHRSISILGSLLLDSEVPDSYADPDLMMLTRGWTRYDIPAVLQNYMAVPLLPRTSTTQLQGSVNTMLLNKPVKDAVVSLIVPQLYLSASTTTDNRGQFFFNDADLPENTGVVVSASKADKKSQLVLKIQEEDYPPYEGIIPRYLPQARGKEQQLLSLTDLSDNIQLREIEVKGKRIHETKKERNMVGMADISFGNEEIEKYHATCLHELLRRIPGVFVHEDKCYIRANTSIFGDNPAAIALDGVILDGDYDLDLISMQDIARVDIFKTGNTVIWGPRGGSGVVSIILKDGTEPPNVKQHTYIKRITPLGWQQPSEFYIDLTDSSQPPATIYWNPSVSLKGNATTDNTLTIPVTPHITRYDILIEGVTSEGRLIHEECEAETDNNNTDHDYRQDKQE